VNATLTHPGAVQARLQEIEAELAVKQNEMETAALAFYRSKREREKSRADEFIAATVKGDGKTRTIAERNAIADQRTALKGVEEEARWEGLRAVVRTLEARATIGASLLKAQGRGG
jgi:hypothetical protein